MFQGFTLKWCNKKFFCIGYRERGISVSKSIFIQEAMGYVLELAGYDTVGHTLSS